MSSILDLLGLFGAGTIVLFLILVGADRGMRHEQARTGTKSDTAAGSASPRR